jgi:hypothetical protein
MHYWGADRLQQFPNGFALTVLLFDRYLGIFIQRLTLELKLLGLTRIIQSFRKIETFIR